MQAARRAEGRLASNMPGALARIFIIPETSCVPCPHPDLRLEWGGNSTDIC